MPPPHAYNSEMIEKVGYTRPALSPKAAAKAAKAGAAGFSQALNSAEAALGGGDIEAAAQAQALTGTGSLLGFQEVDAEDFERRKAFKKGRLTLEALAQLRDALLMGSLPMTTIQKLEQVVAAERGTTTDPTLNAILDEIELRAAVELAKIEVALEAARATPQA